MSEYTVYFSQSVGAVERVEADDPEDAIDKTWDNLPHSLCHQCACEFDLAGDWEPDIVVDENNKEVWTRKLPQR